MTKAIRKRLPRPLNPQQRRFVECLLSGMSAADAASTAGYHGQNAQYVLLNKPHVNAAVVSGALERAKESGELSAEWLRDKLLEGIAKPMRSSQVQCLQMACRTIPSFFKDKEGGDVTVYVAIVNDLAERLSEGRKRLNESRITRGLPPVDVDVEPVLSDASLTPSEDSDGSQ